MTFKWGAKRALSIPPPDPPRSSSPYVNQTKHLQPADQLTELRPATYLLPRLTTTSTSTHPTHPRESIVKFRSPGRVYMVRVSPWRATRRHLPVPCGYFGAGLVPNTFNPNAGFPKLVYLDPDIDERVVVYLPSWPITGPAQTTPSIYGRQYCVGGRGNVRGRRLQSIVNSAVFSW